MESNEIKKWFTFMFILWLLILAGLVGSCSVENKVFRHVRKAEKHINKAVALDPSIKVNKTDTVTVRTTNTKVDTVFNNQDSIVYITTTNTITDTIYIGCPEYDFSDVKTNAQRRQEQRTKRTELRQTEKSKRVEVRNENKSSVFWTWVGRQWWIFLILGALGYWAVRRFLFP